MVKSSIMKFILSTSCKTAVQHTQETFYARDQGWSMGLGAEDLGTEVNLGTGWTSTCQGMQHPSWVPKDRSIDSLRPGAAQRTKVHDRPKGKRGQAHKSIQERGRAKAKHTFTMTQEGKV